MANAILSKQSLKPVYNFSVKRYPDTSYDPAREMPDLFPRVPAPRTGYPMLRHLPPHVRSSRFWGSRSYVPAAGRMPAKAGALSPDALRQSGSEPDAPQALSAAPRPGPAGSMPSGPRRGHPSRASENTRFPGNQDGTAPDSPDNCSRPAGRTVQQ